MTRELEMGGGGCLQLHEAKDVKTSRAERLRRMATDAENVLRVRLRSWGLKVTSSFGSSRSVLTSSIWSAAKVVWSLKSMADNTPTAQATRFATTASGAR
jgi:hypothetical protein